jgi:hypothetical protein
LFFEFAGRFDPPAFQNATSAALPCVRVAPKVGVQEGGLSFVRHDEDEDKDEGVEEG